LILKQKWRSLRLQIIEDKGMKKAPTWQYDEMKQIGVDYANIAEVEEYDAFHRKFRDIKQENEEILNKLAVQKTHHMLEFGTGTGAFAIQAARCCEKVYAVDVSKAMLDYAKNKALSNGISNITFHHSGFLTYEHNEAPVDCVVTSFALHHLPDFWKALALQRINHLLKEGGKLFIVDVVYSGENAIDNIANWIAQVKCLGDKAVVEDVEIHVREEYSTFSWILEKLLETSGFRIDNADYHEGVFAQYLCTKTEGA
jgi:putative AdoMet-dependent methyltransferase